MSDEQATSFVPEHPRERICRALAGLDSAGPQIGEGGGESGPPLHDAAAQGWTVEMEAERVERSGPAGSAPKVVTYRFYVDHVGMGRKDALPMYLAALLAAGLGASMGPLHEGSTKQVAWLQGRYDASGRRIV